MPAPPEGKRWVAMGDIGTSERRLKHVGEHRNVSFKIAVVSHVRSFHGGKFSMLFFGDV